MTTSHIKLSNIVKALLSLFSDIAAISRRTVEALEPQQERAKTMTVMQRQASKIKNIRKLLC